MTQFDFIRDIAKYGLENDQERLLFALSELIDHSKKSKKINFALQLQSLIKESIRQQQNSGLVKVGSNKHILREEDREINEFIIEKLTSDYKFSNLVCSTDVRENLEFFVKEHKSINILKQFDLPISNKILLHGPSGCGKTLAAYVLAGELEKMMVVVNLGAIVSSKLGETSKNLAKLFRKATTENTIIFIDEFDSLGKIRDYSQDHGEMKRVVNTILQLFDYLPQENLVIAATNQKEMIDEALVRRFDAIIKLELPNESQIKELIALTLKKGNFKFDNTRNSQKIIKSSLGLSYFSIQKTLITALKRTLLSYAENLRPITATISTGIWQELVTEEKKNLIRS
ncbi:MAG: AAA family ATPase [Bacteroidetes bacterium RIFOXYA12_FULL_35_11]|nr:MAG: AAA family ATPase [Bacteroidetes bacterium GWF2_35_48]OFY82634.1 MAG: AAA family ATPase [Bacteroidetes bacterium RIFOXYA12_FULL_35_11]OFY96577.1 MAG: AAA family ATPase [Bacteroidetes bacterium RIFOXYB2_FULL_35_7]OFY97245.1 MAG: AAA family ATPase [Bacteroidetes bacterium RIFOXYC12_FULL_35_7]HBX51343.1 AAA family ATPase [Bacteroidales bacterium]